MNVMKKMVMAAVVALCGMWGVCAQGQTPALRHVMDIRAEISGAYNGGKAPHGERVVIPITGGEVTGEISGKVIPGGADYQLVDGARCRGELCAIYSIMTEDSTLINVRNEGINCWGEGNQYFVTSPKFECNVDSKYGWLNDRIFVCRPVGFEPGAIVLRVWAVE